MRRPLLRELPPAAVEAVASKAFGGPVRVRFLASGDWDLALTAGDCTLWLHPESGPYDLLLGTSLLAAERCEAGVLDSRRATVATCRLELLQRFPGMARQPGRLRTLADEEVASRVQWRGPARSARATTTAGCSMQWVSAAPSCTTEPACSPARTAARFEGCGPSLAEMPWSSVEVAFDDHPRDARSEVLRAELVAARPTSRWFRECYESRHASSARMLRRQVARGHGSRTLVVFGADVHCVGEQAAGGSGLSRRFVLAVLDALRSVAADLHAVAFLDEVRPSPGRYERRMAVLKDPRDRAGERMFLRLDRTLRAAESAVDPVASTTLQYASLLDLAERAVVDRGYDCVQVVYLGTRGLGERWQAPGHWLESAVALEERIARFDRECGVERGGLAMFPSGLRRAAAAGSEVAATGAKVGRELGRSGRGW